ncbi:hypothetical protein BDV96DRAFT_607205 [Lophiotrema nucula]|uniref:Uncharacterized protein n=1 Tax=Lophiotrema nucula TaxID=690887 RepID=A0A6A5YI32_9PLEO|nr:hypothetical protein BDV96DRAFT_607205 [Lophiotrema nucula]
MTTPISDTLPSAEDAPTIEIVTCPTGDDSGFHTSNNPENPYQRKNVIQRESRVIIKCDHKDIIHGYFSNDINDLYTLIIYEFRFHPNGPASRIKEAHVVLKYSAMTIGKLDPEVVNLYPDGGFFVDPALQHEEVTAGGGVNFGAGGAVAQVGAELKAEKSTQRDTTSYTTITGGARTSRGVEPNDSVRWDLLENQTTKSGVVSTLQVAVLLKRRSMDPFKASIAITVTADLRSQIQMAFKREPQEDDVWYDPRKPPTDRLHKYDVDNIGKLNLKDLGDVTARTIVPGAVKAQR